MNNQSDLNIYSSSQTESGNEVNRVDASFDYF